MEMEAPEVTTTRVRCLEPSCVGREGLVYSKETRHEITESVDVVLHDARALRNDGDQLRRRGFVMGTFWLESLHPQLNEYLINSDPSSRQRGREGDMGVQDMARCKEIRKALYARGAEWAKQTLGAKYAFALSHTCRYGNQGHTDGRAYLTSYATFAHCDYTTSIIDGDAGWRALVKNGVDEAEAKRMDVGYYNIWQSTNGTVEQNPLALSDWSTTQDEDAHGVELGHTATYGDSVK
eukprot:COSAG02_NODE_11121_length_1789_cov_1.101183_1_plen_237_part_00